MTERAYEFTGEKRTIDGITLYRIRATEGNKAVPPGTLGGWIQSPSNLLPDAWIEGEACIYGDARAACDCIISGEAQVYGYAICYGDCRIKDRARVHGQAQICGDAVVCDDAEVYDRAEVSDHATVSGHAKMYGRSRMFGKSVLTGTAQLHSEEKYYYANLYGDFTLDNGDWTHGPIDSNAKKKTRNKELEDLDDDDEI